MLLIIVYVGAVAVLFLFVVMMLDVDFAELKGGDGEILPLGLVIGVVFVDAADDGASACGAIADTAEAARARRDPSTITRRRLAC